jgi:hypothetical protein
MSNFGRYAEECRRLAKLATLVHSRAVDGRWRRRGMSQAGLFKPGGCGQIGRQGYAGRTENPGLTDAALADAP